MPDRTKCVAIAKDVLERLDYLNVYKGHYLALNQDVLLPEEGNAQDLLPQLEQNCQVCALGACFLSHIRLYDEVDIGEVNWYGGSLSHRRTIISKLKKYFGESQLDMIETAFEGYVPREKEINFETLMGIHRFWRKFDNYTERLRAIMENIVSNNGEFNPTKGEHRVEEEASNA
jgi:hypothetical protein